MADDVASLSFRHWLSLCLGASGLAVLLDLLADDPPRLDAACIGDDVDVRRVGEPVDRGLLQLQGRLLQ